MFLAWIVCILGADELLKGWREYLDQYSHTFYASISIEDVSELSNRSNPLWVTDMSVARSDKLWMIKFVRNSKTEAFKFGKEISASQDQVAECQLVFSPKDNLENVAKRNWMGFVQRDTSSESTISQGLWGLGFPLGFYDVTSLKTVDDVVKKATDLNSSQSSSGTVVRGSAEGIAFDLVFGDHPCPKRIEYRYARDLGDGKQRQIVILVDEIGWESQAKLPREFLTVVTYQRPGESNTRYARSKIELLPDKSLPKTTLEFSSNPSNGTKVRARDLPSECIFQGGRIVPAAPSRSDVAFSRETNTGGWWWSIVLGLLTIVIVLFVIKRRNN